MQHLSEATLFGCVNIIKNHHGHSLRLKTASSDRSISFDSKRVAFLQKWSQNRNRTLQLRATSKLNKEYQDNEKIFDRLISVHPTVPSHIIPHANSAQQLGLTEQTNKCKNEKIQRITHNSLVRLQKERIRIQKANGFIRNRILSVRSQYSQAMLKGELFGKSHASQTSRGSKKDTKNNSDWTMNYGTEYDLVKIKSQRIYCDKMKMMKKANNIFLKRLKEQQTVTKRVLDSRSRTFIT